jgi:hypothetical protein
MLDPKAYRAVFVALGFFVALSAAYVAGWIAFELRFGIEWAAPISAVVFAFVVLSLRSRSS